MYVRVYGRTGQTRSLEEKQNVESNILWRFRTKWREGWLLLLLLLLLGRQRDENVVVVVVVGWGGAHRHVSQSRKSLSISHRYAHTLSLSLSSSLLDSLLSTVYRTWKDISSKMDVKSSQFVWGWMIDWLLCLLPQRLDYSKSSCEPRGQHQSPEASREFVCDEDEAEGEGPHILTVASSDTDANIEWNLGFHATQFTVREWPSSTAIGVSRFRFQIYTLLSSLPLAINFSSTPPKHECMV